MKNIPRPTSLTLSLLRKRFSDAPCSTEAPFRSGSTIFHITVHKAGSQWIRRLLSHCAPERIVQPKPNDAHLLEDPIKRGYIYPAACLTKKDFDQIKKPNNSRHFVIFRDLRDILVSAYFSLRFSHSTEDKRILEYRKGLSANCAEDGMLWVLSEWLPGVAEICASWVDSREEWIRYEDLLENDVEILEEVLIDRCGLEIDRQLFMEHVLNCRFSQISGRMPGQEDINSHYRKGVAGDWRNYFTPKIKGAFKGRYEKLLMKMGYERNNGW